MPDLTATIPHRLSREEAKRRIQEHVGIVRQQYSSVLMDIRETWTDDNMAFSFRAMGQAITGRLNVDDSAVHLTVALPWLLAMLAEKIKPQIEERGRLALS